MKTADGKRTDFARSKTFRGLARRSIRRQGADILKKNTKADILTKKSGHFVRDFCAMPLKMPVLKRTIIVHSILYYNRQSPDRLKRRRDFYHIMFYYSLRSICYFITDLKRVTVDLFKRLGQIVYSRKIIRSHHNRRICRSNRHKVWTFQICIIAHNVCS